MTGEGEEEASVLVCSLTYSQAGVLTVQPDFCWAGRPIPLQAGWEVTTDMSSFAIYHFMFASRSGLAGARKPGPGLGRPAEGVPAG